jgi:hypothetical protein
MPAKPKIPTDIPASITTPDRVETRLGTLRFFDGLPDEATVQTVYDNLDFQRGVQAFLTAFPAASLYATRTGYRTFGPDNQTVLIAESLLDSRTLFLLANTETIDSTIWGDTKDGQLAIEVPPHLLRMIDDFWCRYVCDVGNAGPDKGQGGKYLLLPPGHTGDVPERYFVVRSRTYGSFILLRGFVVNGDPRPAVENMKRNLCAYPLARAANPPAMSFVNISGQDFNTIPAIDASFFAEVAHVVQEEPLDPVDPETRGLLAAIGIRKGTLFAPDARMKGILADAWTMNSIGDDAEFSPGGVLNPGAEKMHSNGVRTPEWEAMKPCRTSPLPRSPTRSLTRKRSRSASKPTCTVTRSC